MDLSIMLFRLFGIFWLIVGGAYLVRQDRIRGIVSDFYNHSGLTAIASILNLIFGLLIALNYSHWEFSARGFITLVAYLMILKGVMLLYFPEFGQKLAKSVSEKKSLFPLAIVIMLLGVWLIISSF